MTSIILNKRQQLVYTLITQGKNVFITGGGGVGKSEVVKSFYNQYKNNKIIAITSTTGASALLIGGTTLHSYLGIGLGTSSVDILSKKIVKRPYLRNRWRDLQILFIDEVSMLSPELFDKINEIAKIVRRIDLPFGGIQIVLSGDFCQLPCVNSCNFCFESKSWSEFDFQIVELNEIIRQKNIDFQNCLNEIRMGNVSNNTKKLLETRINKSLTNDLGIEPTKLYPLNYKVESVNNKRLNKLLKSTKEVFEYDLDIEEKKKNLNTDKLLKNCNAVQNLKLTKGCQVMLICNLDIDSGLVNGSRGVVSDFVESIPVVTFLNGEKRVIDYHEWEIKENDKKVASIFQIPLKLGYAFSIHKSQGCTLDYVIVDLRNIFEYGMGYVALSRVKNLDGLSIVKSIDWNKINIHPKALQFYKNIKND